MRNAMSVGTRSRRIDGLDQLIVESLTHIVFLVFFFFGVCETSRLGNSPWEIEFSSLVGMRRGCDSVPHKHKV